VNHALPRATLQELDEQGEVMQAPLPKGEGVDFAGVTNG
jgi:hypothetical protein